MEKMVDSSRLSYLLNLFIVFILSASIVVGLQGFEPRTKGL
jgi:hypothetical protein